MSSAAPGGPPGRRSFSGNWANQSGESVLARAPEADHARRHERVAPAPGSDSPDRWRAIELLVAGAQEAEGVVVEAEPDVETVLLDPPVWPTRRCTLSPEPRSTLVDGDLGSSPPGRLSCQAAAKPAMPPPRIAILRLAIRRPASRRAPLAPRPARTGRLPVRASSRSAAGAEASSAGPRRPRRRPRGCTRRARAPSPPPSNGRRCCSADRLRFADERACHVRISAAETMLGDLGQKPRHPELGAHASATAPAPGRPSSRSALPPGREGGDRCSAAARRG